MKFKKVSTVRFISRLFFPVRMRVAILYSGGKDSTNAIEFAKNKGWEISYLLSVKPTRTDCYLFHYATVEQTKELSEILGIKHFYVSCDVADPKKEAEIVRNVVEKNSVDAVILGGIGLQITQIRSVQEALRPLGVEVFASHAGLDHDRLIKEMIERGYKIMISQIASEGLNKEWLGKILTKDNVKEFFDRAEKYGFHVGGEGGYFDTLVLDAPIFEKSLNIEEIDKVMESRNCGHVVVKKAKVVKKSLA